ncbi:unnamed protein product [Protopolystoma xenopodis]|uniref:Uncharacterized protein n=1 Tax=Protopolystoma xenopodis TaxID=117903 RepID=A0A3S4ZVJ9_9PLAT|nr:unnamed protein product [Protopolystoma xenopodis]
MRPPRRAPTYFCTRVCAVELVGVNLASGSLIPPVRPRFPQQSRCGQSRPVLSCPVLSVIGAAKISCLVLAASGQFMPQEDVAAAINIESTECCCWITAELDSSCEQPMVRAGLTSDLPSAISSGWLKSQVFRRKNGCFDEDNHGSFSTILQAGFDRAF